jgi:CRP/FNR family cyclic AMP-dependent transcriptional regulator
MPSQLLECSTFIRTDRPPTIVMSTQSQIRQIELFTQLAPATLDQLAAIAHRRTFQDGQLIMLKGDPDAPVFFVLQGIVRVLRTNPDGREQTLIHLSQGAAFNLPAVFSRDRSAPATALAVGDVEMLQISPGNFRRVTSQNMELALAILQDLANKLHYLTDLTYDLSLRSVRGRLARFLLDQVQAEHAEPVRWTHEEIAAQVGSVREVVSRTLRSFVQGGLIMERQRIVVLDYHALEQEAES